MATEPEEAEGDMVSGDFFSGLGVKLMRGRGFTNQDEQDHAPLAVISYNYWTRRFARDRGCVGKDVVCERGFRITIVGIAAAGFEGRGRGRLDGFLDSAAEPAGVECMGQPAGQRESLTSSRIRPGGACGCLAGLPPGVTQDAGDGRNCSRCFRARPISAWAPRAGRADPGAEPAGCEELSGLREHVWQAAADPDGNGGVWCC